MIDGRGCVVVGMAKAVVIWSGQHLCYGCSIATHRTDLPTNQGAVRMIQAVTPHMMETLEGTNSEMQLPNRSKSLHPLNPRLCHLVVQVSMYLYYK